jgi:two-component system sensor histidine kinase/response regulator
VISDGLDYSKVEADELIIERSPFSLKLVLADLASLFRGVAEEKGIYFQSNIDTELPACVVGDNEKLTQVLNNLLSNACKFTEEGEVRLLVELDHADEVGVGINFTVSDTGIGKTKDEMQHVFQPFQQADSSTTRKFGGTGLGLTIADRIVRQMGGAIAVDSQKENGSLHYCQAGSKTILSTWSHNPLCLMRQLISLSKKQNIGRKIMI